jgi:serine/threonine-protein kinase RsbT
MTTLVIDEKKTSREIVKDHPVKENHEGVEAWNWEKAISRINEGNDALRIDAPVGDTQLRKIIPISSVADIKTAREHGRSIATKLGFSGSDPTIITTAISEIARNIIEHAKRGNIMIQPVKENSKHGIAIIAQDEGPGIPDVTRAMQDGFSTGKGLGLGLPGSKRLMDEFKIISEVGKGTTIHMKKWKNVSYTNPSPLIQPKGIMNRRRIGGLTL